MKLPVIAVDGPAASGKGSVAQRLGAHLQFAVLDTGVLYRAVAVQVVQEGGDPNDADVATRVAQHLDMARLSESVLRTAAAAAAASKVAVHVGVRAALLQFQRDFASVPPLVAGDPARGAILDGRDIGTVVLPDADIKFFITAQVEVRAQRRLRDLQQHDPSIDYLAVLHDLQARDARDQSRAAAPMRMADDAICIDSTHLSLDEVMQQVQQHVQGVLVAHT